MLKVVRVALAAFVIALSPLTVHAQNPAVGSWDFTVVSPLSETKSVLVISEEAGALKADAKGAQGERPLDKIAVDGAKITLVMTINYEGSPMVITYTGKIDGAKMEGEADYGGLATGTWSASAQK